MNKQLYGRFDNQDVFKYTLKNLNLEMDVINYGCTIIDLRLRTKTTKCKAWL